MTLNEGTALKVCWFSRALTINLLKNIAQINLRVRSTTFLNDEASSRSELFKIVQISLII